MSLYEVAVAEHDLFLNERKQSLVNTFKQDFKTTLKIEHIEMLSFGTEANFMIDGIEFRAKTDGDMVQVQHGVPSLLWEFEVRRGAGFTWVSVRTLADLGRFLKIKS